MPLLTRCGGLVGALEGTDVELGGSPTSRSRPQRHCLGQHPRRGDVDAATLPEQLLHVVGERGHVEQRRGGRRVDDQFDVWCGLLRLTLSGA